MAWKPFTAMGCRADISLLPTQTPAWRWPRRMNPSIAPLRQQDPSVTSLCHTLIKAVYLFRVFFFQVTQFLPVICLGPSFPPTFKLCCSASAAKTPSFCYSSSPLIMTCFPLYTHTFPPQTHPGSVRLKP